ncbi:MAG: hypothetical protein UV09_C0012G0071 [Candidatus Gottesmanbacteria bacterium GW2011_GWA2_42_18]|uniref:Uncharacterized protein n=1 Tax=Candidatus Gottesmanbacteria bacterium GW2011_GWA2_42_18 TaxID=1618442 RepID=A0A0G0ZDU4_9BACT|nr:MAG: hypothetical protein UV09_C0012G0071 [Candidatus Gottesmanbacteria bacterium GW2011_GWA2_42_18]KKS76322.1 MAG: hypothetical protein UV46_C0004G0008 [Candidatus Gottesmanbacteria bacterium GW2011_GWC2_42_8]
MTVDNVTIFWALFLIGLSLIGVIIAFMYLASKKSKK